MTRLFPTVVGHDAARAMLGRALAAGSLNGSFLFCGPEGVGRGLLARELAMALNCNGDRRSVDDLPCRTCGPCHRIAKGVCGDVHLIRPVDKPSIGIDQVQEMLAELALAPVECRSRVFVFEPASAMSEPAQNALLKGLEEPPQNAVILLIAEREEELLATIASRCRVVRLGELTRPEVLEVLKGQGLSGPEAEARAAWSQGSPGLALADDAPALAELGRDLVEALASGDWSRNPGAVVDRLATWVQPGKVEARVQRGRIVAALGILMRTLRDAVTAQAGATGPRLSGADPAALERLAALPQVQLAAAVDHLATLEDEVSRNLNTKLLLDGLALDLGRALAPPTKVRA